MEAHAHRDRKRLAGSGSSRERAGSRGEDHEEGIALRVDLDTTLGRDGLADNAPMLGKSIRIPVGTEFVHD